MKLGGSVLSSSDHPFHGPCGGLVVARVGQAWGEATLSLGQLEQRALTRGQVGDVAGARELEGDVLGGLQLTELH